MDTVLTRRRVGRILDPVANMSTTLRYPIAAVSRLTGLPLDTIRAWERRYGAVVPERGPRGRVFTGAEVQRLRLLAALVEQGHTIGQVAALPTPRLEELLHRTPPAPSPGPAAAARHAIAPILDAIDRFDSTAVNREITRLSALFAPRDFVYEVVLPLMRVVGERWHQGRLSIAQEHLVSAILHGVMGTLLRLHAAPPTASRLLFASPEGERHEFGLLAAAMLAGAAGLDVVYLGPSLPATEIAAAARDSAVLAVVLAVSGGAAAVVAGVQGVRRSLAPHVELWVGGADPAGIPGRTGGRRRVVPIGSFEEFERHLRRVGGR
jgi:MerR family transcriptional regulator, light-induced transcriptional regulator